MPKLEERMALVIQMHEDLRHFGEQKTLVEICQRYFWHNKIEDVKDNCKNVPTVPNGEKNG